MYLRKRTTRIFSGHIDVRPVSKILLLSVKTLDEEYHYNDKQTIKDQDRQQILENMDLNFLRFSENDVCNRMEDVLAIIRNFISDYEEHHQELKKTKGR